MFIVFKAVERTLYPVIGQYLTLRQGSTPVSTAVYLTDYPPIFGPPENKPFPKPDTAHWFLFNFPGFQYHIPLVSKHSSPFLFEVYLISPYFSIYLKTDMSEINGHNLLYDKSKELAQAVVESYYTQYPESKGQFGAEGYRKSIQDAEYHFLYLAEAVATKEPRLFLDYLNWTRTLFNSINLPISVLERTLLLMKDALQSRFNNEVVQRACSLIDDGLTMLSQEPVIQKSYIEGNGPLDILAQKYLQALLQGDRKKAENIIGDAVQNGVSIKDIYIQIFQRTQQELGRLWQINKTTVAQEHYCTSATQMIMSQLYPFIFSGELKERHIVIACVGGELHEIGARMVADIFEVEGWDSYFIGANTPLKDLLHTIRAKKIDIVALSVTMTYHLPELREYISKIRDTSRGIKIMVGGYPFNTSPSLWEKIGADAWASDAINAVKTAEGLLA